MIPTAPLSFWEFFDFISVGVLSLIIGYLVIDHRQKTGSILGTISKTVAHTPQSSLVFSIAMTLFFPTYYAFLYFWVGPKVGAPRIFYLLLIISALCELIFVWVPALPGKKNSIHSLAAGMVGIFMFVLPLSIDVANTHVSELGRIAIITYLLTSGILGLSLLIKKLRTFSFAYEVAYCGLFLIAMSVVGHS